LSLSQDEAPRKQFNELEVLRGWNDWNCKSLSKYLEAILLLPLEERRKDRGVSWGSIQDVFLHIIENYIWWFEMVPQGKKEEREWVGHEVDEKELRSLTQRAIDSANKFMDSLTLEDLGHPYVVHGTVESGEGKQEYTMTTCPADIVWHMVEEQLQHIGEINALFWQMGIDPKARAWFSSELAWTH
jgi:uncharacterized damage-inducible protein DinB